MFKKLLSGIMAVAVCVVGLSGCGESPPEEVEMPDVVFVMYQYYPIEKEYSTGNFIGTSGCYIDKNGKIRRFEFEDEQNITGILENKNISMKNYFKTRNLDAFYEKVIENSYETEYSPIPKEDLLNCYKLLLKVDMESELNYQDPHVTAILGLYCIYGIRINEKNEMEYMMIHEFGDAFYESNNKYSNKLYKQINELIAKNKLYQTWLYDEKIYN